MAEDLRLQKCEIKFYSIFFCTFIVVENELNAVVIMTSYLVVKFARGVQAFYLSE